MKPIKSSKVAFRTNWAFPLKIRNIHWKTSVLQSLFNNVATQVFSLEYCKIFRNSYFVEHLWWLLKCRVMTLKQVNVASTVFLRSSFRKLFLNYWSVGTRICWYLTFVFMMYEFLETIFLLCEFPPNFSDYNNMLITMKKDATLNLSTFQ